MENLDKQSSTSSLEIASSSTLKKRVRKTIFKQTRHPIYKGVRRRNTGKWVCEALSGDNASLNFPNSARSLPRANSSSRQDIQMVALQMAKDFRPSSSGENNAGSEICSAAELKCDADTKERSNGCSGLVVDEEETFNMPVLLDSMAEGMLLTPLAMKKGFNWSHEVDDEFALSLWDD